jgi:photosystem II stability/assembly factor-like uncharacterized protein
MNIRIVIITCFLLILGIPARAQWVQSSNGIADNYNISCFAVIGQDIYAGGTGFPGGVYRSTDDGSNWTFANNGLPGNSYDYIISLAAIGTDLYMGTLDSGVYRSTDSGASWTAENTGLSNASVNSLANIGTTLFAGTMGDGIYRSVNNGASWTSANVGLTDPVVNAIAVVGPNLFAGTPDSGIYRSTDNGANWTRENEGLSNLDITTFAVRGMNLFAGTYAGVYRSNDSGTNWTSASSGLPTSHIVALAVYGTTNLFVSDLGTVWLSTNNGVSWTVLPVYDNNILFSSLALMGTNLFGGGYGVWRLSLSSLGVTETAESQSEIKINSFPNPFSQSTQITFSSQSSGYAEVSIVNMLGMEVARLFSGELGAGEHNFLWDKPTGLPDGTHECLVRMNGQVETLPIVLMR